MNHLMMKNRTIMKMKQLRNKNGRMIKLKQAKINSNIIKSSICNLIYFASFI